MLGTLGTLICTLYKVVDKITPYTPCRVGNETLRRISNWVMKPRSML